MLKPLHGLHGIEIEDRLPCGGPFLPVVLENGRGRAEIGDVGIVLHPAALDPAVSGLEHPQLGL